MTPAELCAWLREHSSGVYRPAADAADLIESLLRQNAACVAGPELPVERIVELADENEWVNPDTGQQEFDRLGFARAVESQGRAAERRRLEIACKALREIATSGAQVLVMIANDALGEIEAADRLEGALAPTPTSTQARPSPERMATIRVLQEFLDWNRAQVTPLVAIGNEYAVAQQVLDIHNLVFGTRDTDRLDWLETMDVNVRIPLRYGSKDLFWATNSDLDDPGPADLRALIDANMPAPKKSAKATRGRK